MSECIGEAESSFSRPLRNANSMRKELLNFPWWFTFHSSEFQFSLFIIHFSAESLIRNERVYRGGRIEFLAAVEKGELDEEGGGHDVGVEGLEEFDRCRGRSARGEEVIDEQDVLAGLYGVFVNFHDSFAIFKGVGHRASGPRELSFLADRDKPGPEDLRHARGENEATSVNSDHFVDAGVAGGGGQMLQRSLEKVGVAEDGSDIFEDDPRLREVLHVADGSFEIGDGGEGHRKKGVNVEN
jgi:hypothetical protein